MTAAYDRVRRALVRAIAAACADPQIAVLGEGVETEGEAQTLRELRVTPHQGYLYASGVPILPVPIIFLAVKTAVAA